MARRKKPPAHTKPKKKPPAKKPSSSGSGSSPGTSPGSGSSSPLGQSSSVATPGNTGTGSDMAPVQQLSGPYNDTGVGAGDVADAVYSSGAGAPQHYHSQPTYIEQVATATGPGTTQAGATSTIPQPGQTVTGP